MRWLFAAALLCFPLRGYAAPIANPSAMAPVSSTATQVGIAAAIRGSVTIRTGGQVGRVVGSGEPIYLGDEISTDGEGSLQILLLDETAFTIGPNSTIVIDRFVYDPSNDEGEVKAKVVKGVFRFVTGKIARKKPSQMEVELPVGVVGIRGTIVAGETTGKRSMVALLGPGEKNNTAHRKGSFTLKGEGQTKGSFVGKTGFGATIDEGGIPSSPFQVPEVDLARLTKALGPVAPSGGAQGGSGGSGDSGEGDGDGSTGSSESPTDQAGQGTAVAGDSVHQAGAVGGMLSKLGKESQVLSQQTVNEAANIFDGPATRDQLQLAAQSIGGIHHFSASNVSLSAGDMNGQAGTADIVIDIDFGSRQVGGGNSGVTGSFTLQSTTFEYDLSTPIPFGTGPFPAFYQFSDVPKEVSSTCADCAYADVTLGVLNQGGEIASHAVVALQIKPVAGQTTPESIGAGIASREHGMSV